MKPFQLAEYKDPKSGKTPTDDLADALRDFLDDGLPLIKLAAFRRYLAAEGQLYGRCLERIQPGNIQVWVYSQGRFHIIYSYYRARNEVCLLKFVNGDAKNELDDAKERVRRFYSGR